MVPGRLGGDLWRRLAALLAADPLEGVRREDDRRRPATDVAVPILPRCKNKRGETQGQYLEGQVSKYSVISITVPNGIKSGSD